MSKVHDFNECKEIGLKAEKIIINNFRKVFKPILYRLVNTKQIVFDIQDKETIAKQKKGIDGQILINYDVKSLNSRYKEETRILLETVSIVENNTKGWLFTCESDIIVLVYWNDREKKEFYKGYLLFPKILRNWYEKNNINDVYGIDGDNMREQFLINGDRLLNLDLTKPIDLGRKFDLVICLEVAEHLDEKYSETLIDTAVNHSNTIFWSAANEGQGGYNHVNEQSNKYWIDKFKKRGYEHKLLNNSFSPLPHDYYRKNAIEFKSYG